MVIDYFMKYFSNVSLVITGKSSVKSMMFRLLCVLFYRLCVFPNKLLNYKVTHFSLALSF